MVKSGEDVYTTGNSKQPKKLYLQINSCNKRFSRKKTIKTRKQKRQEFECSCLSNLSLRDDRFEGENKKNSNMEII